MKTYGFLLVLLAALLHASAAAAQDVSANPAPTSGAFDTVVDEYFDLYFGFHPTAATAAGFHQYDEKLEDLSRAGLEREAAALRSFLPKLEKARSAPLPQQSADDLEFVQSQIRSRLLELETIRMWEKDPDPYASQPAYSLFLLMKRHFAPPEVRLRSIIARERQIPAMLDAARHNLKNPPRVYTDVALQQIPGTIEFFRRDVPAAFSVVKDPKLLAEFRASNQQAITALEKYENFLREDLLPVSHGDFRLGAENFQKKLLYDEMVDIPLARLREIGYADLRRNQEQLKQVAAQVDPRRSTSEVLATLRNDHPAPDQLLQTFRDALGSLRRFIEQNHIVTIPSTAEPVVEETPPFSRALTSAAMDTPGPYETKDTQGIFEVTLPDRGWKPDKVREYMEEYSRGIIVSTATHEVYPGHYLQYLWSLRASSKVRKLLYCDSNSEGWAHYTEQMMLDEGYSKDPRIRMGQVTDALLRDARFIAGLEMHTGNMTLDQATEFFVKEGYQVRPIAEMEAQRGTNDPTYLVYTLGKLQIRKLREDYKQLRGDKFTLQEFHDHFMEQGGLPLRIVRRAMLGNDSPTL